MNNTDTPKDWLDKMLDDFAQQSFGAVWTSKTGKVEFDHEEARQTILDKLKLEKIEELEWLLDNHDAENSFGYFIQDRLNQHKQRSE